MITKKRGKKPALQLWLSRLLSRRTQFALDIVTLAAAFTSAYLLRYEFAIPDHVIIRMLIQLPCVLSIQFTALIFTGVYMFIWRYVGMAEMKAFLKAALWSALPLVMLRVCAPETFQTVVPFSVIVIDTALGFGGVLGLRVLRRALYERNEKQQRAANGSNGQRKPVLLVGAGGCGIMAAKEILSRGDRELVIKGFVDDDPKKQGSVILGIKVLGFTWDLPRLVRDLGIDHVVITINHVRRRDISRIVKLCESIPVTVRIIPPFSEILEGKVEVSRIRNVLIEDLLGRAPVQLDEEDMKCFVAGKTVMITGAGGSIGGEIARQVAQFQPSSLLLVDRAEFGLFNIHRELRELRPELSITPLVADVGDETKGHAIFTAHRPQVILHAAAHKHVPLMELNPSEAVKNNILATHRLGELAGEYGAEVFLLISTDKAVRPTSVMGASKRVAELVVQDLNRRFATRYVAVRFGNVIGSTGSVIPIFREQIRKGGPVTVTHPEMKRYFMTIPEAVQLVLKAAAMGEGGEIFILDMGDPVSILDLARDLITLSGFKPFEDINIVFTGVRAGEKLFEELETLEEHMTRTQHPKIFIGKIAPFPAEKVRDLLEQLTFLAGLEQEQEIRRLLNEMLPEARLDAIQPATPLADFSALSVPDQPRVLDNEHLDSLPNLIVQYETTAD
jgi:FlaA1/EpsC-like NDP-sugar epimerase